MGKTTWLSLKKKPLPGRLNIILSKNDTSLFSNFKNDNIKCFSSLESMFKFLNTIEYNKIFVIGGSIIFQSILKVRKLILVHKTVTTKITFHLIPER